VLLVDTAGRLHVDEAMMDEIKQVHAAINPVETLFVVDAMTGQDAANTAKAFNEALPLTGVVLTKVDGDARGGAALSIRHITGKPIKFLGVGEKTEALEPFHPDRIASRILGMGDVLSLIEDIESKVDRAQAEKLASKLKKGDGFDLTDFLEQLRQMKNMGGMASLMGKLPGMGQIPDNVKAQMDDKVLVRMEAIINSMTLKERANPDIIKGSRKRRIAAGCGMQVQDVNRPSETVRRHAAHDEENEERRHGEDDAWHEGHDAARIPWPLIARLLAILMPGCARKAHPGRVLQQSFNC
jgi:signal recognition particle subunit SRP54